MIRVSVVRRTLIGPVLALVGIAACATTPVLKPAPGDTLAPGKQNVAQAEVAGVLVFVGGDSWTGDPPTLGQLFTPVLVTIENHGGKTVRVSYADFSLSGSTGFKYAAIPPMSAKGQIGRADPSPSKIPIRLALYEPGLGRADRSDIVQLARWEHGFDHDGFMVAPHFRSYYPGWEAWPYSYPYDPLYYNSLYAYWPEKLPTQDMLSKALPEGAVQDNGKVSGFVYFQGVGTRESTVTFSMNLVDATNGQSLGQVSIPFAVSK
jgi:hypothetical protein